MYSENSKNNQSYYCRVREISGRIHGPVPEAVAGGVGSVVHIERRAIGFHVQHDGLITEVENFGYAWQTGLRQGSRLVEVDVILYEFTF